MSLNSSIKKLYLDSTLNPIIQKNRNGDIIEYFSEGTKTPRYALTYNYICGKLFCIKVKDLNNDKNNKMYSFISIFLAKFKALVLMDKIYSLEYKKHQNFLTELVNNMLIY